MTFSFFCQIVAAALGISGSFGSIQVPVSRTVKCYYYCLTSSQLLELMTMEKKHCSNDVIEDFADKKA